MKRLLFPVALFLLLATQINFAQDSTNYYAHLQPEHREALKIWLADKTGLRPAVESDASKSDLEVWKRDNQNFFPYYAAGDFNQDGKEDFAVFLKVEKTADDGAVVIFNAPFKNSKPAYFKRGFQVHDFYIEYSKEAKMLYLTKYETHGVYFKAKGRKYVEYDPHNDEPQ
ncbi:MAG: FG-GAP repeat protein [Acidobacteriota bacterium]|nr:FG-GAP repeat protein [Acidobacteriota bacterium]